MSSPRGRACLATDSRGGNWPPSLTGAPKNLECGTGVLARQICETPWKLAKLQGETLAPPENCVRLNNQGAASDAPPVRRQTATKLP
jgi:hypothetical protein